MAIIIIAIGNILIGGLVGMTGVAGFLLPILYTAGLGYSTTEGLAFSFLAFIISGWLGSRHYQHEGLMDRRVAYLLSGGSFVGAIIAYALIYYCQPAGYNSYFIWSSCYPALLF